MKNIIEPSQNVDHDDVFEAIQNDAQKRGLSSDQVWEIWQAGISAQHSVQSDVCPTCRGKGFLGSGWFPRPCEDCKSTGKAAKA